MRNLIAIEFCNFKLAMLSILTQRTIIKFVELPPSIYRHFGYYFDTSHDQSRYYQKANGKNGCSSIISGNPRILQICRKIRFLKYNLRFKFLFKKYKPLIFLINLCLKLELQGSGKRVIPCFQNKTASVMYMGGGRGGGGVSGNLG